MDRRLLLQRAVAAATGAFPLCGAWAGRGAADYPFALGVASGSPREDGVVLWTRVAAAALPFGRASAQLHWEVADDPAFRRVVAKGEAAALPELGHAVHVEVRGLSPGRWYFYRFMLGDAVSDIGRTRTSPPADAMPDKLRFVFASCQRWEHGFYAAWREAAEAAPDLVVFLGDYIYEYAVPSRPASPLARSHSLRRATTLADYRDRYALHKGDADLRAAHQAAPWIVTWDDHEVENDYAGAMGHASPADFARQRAAAYQAFYENMPLRSNALVRGLAGLGNPDAVRVADRQDFGRLARFHVLDTRQFRDPQACRDPSATGSAGTVRPADCAALADPGRTLLGTAQEAWLDDGLHDDARDGRVRWSIVAQQTLFSPRHYGGANGPVATDTWDGYPAARGRLLDSVARHKPRNTVFVGGDIHQNYVCNVHANPSGNGSAASVLATEFCGTSISSQSGASQDRIAALMQRNPQIVFANSERRGYGLAELTPGGWTTTLRVVEDVLRADSALSTLARFVVEDGRPDVITA